MNPYKKPLTTFYGRQSDGVKILKSREENKRFTDNIIKEVKTEPSLTDDDPLTSMDGNRKEIYMTLMHKNGKTAAAFYEVEKSQVSLFSERQETDKDLSVTRSLIQTVQPVAVIVSRICPLEIQEVVRESMQNFKTPKQVSDKLDTSIQFDSSCMTPYLSKNTTGLMTTSASIESKKEGNVLHEEQDENEETDDLSDDPSVVKKQKKGHKIQFLEKLTENVVSIPAKCFLPDKEYIFTRKESGFHSSLSMDLSSTAVKNAFLAARINFDEELTVRCLAALLCFMEQMGIYCRHPLNKTWASMALKSEGKEAEVSNEAVAGDTSCSSDATTVASSGLIRRVVYFFLPSLVFINENSLRAIGILSEEMSPSTRRLTAVRRPLFSILKIFSEECQSRPGKLLLKKTLMQPLREPLVLRYRHDVISFLSQESNIGLREDLSLNLNSILALNHIFRKMKITLAKVADFKSLLTSLTKMIEVVERLKERRAEPGCPDLLIEKAFQVLPEDSPVIRVLHLIQETIDFAASNPSDPRREFVIRRGVDETLDEGYDVRDKMPEILDEAVFEETAVMRQNHVPHPDFKVLWMEGPGFLMQIPLGQRFLDRVLDFIVRNGGKQVFLDENHSLFFKTPSLEERDFLVQDKIEHIFETEMRIKSELQEKVLSIVDEIDRLTDFCSEVDVLLAFTRVALSSGWTRPEINPGGFISIKDGRHPLLEKKIQILTPNDFDSQETAKKIKVITGPNASGKSVYMKQTCLIVHLALVGSFVPASFASIPLVDKILTRLKAPKTVNNDISSFMSDLKQISSAVDNATDQSLVVIDEFGKGTKPEDGLALLVSIMTYFLKETRPTVMIASHFHSLKHFLPRDHQLLQYLKFQSIHEGDGKFTHDYQIQEGFAEESIARAVYEELGLDSMIINRAAQVTDQLKKRLPLTPVYTEEQESYNETVDQISSVFSQLNVHSREAVITFFQQIRQLHDCI